jgi:hypothetical protein
MNNTHIDQELIIAFIQGAKWWESHKTGATMWQSDQNLAADMAKKRLMKGSLGRDSIDVLRDRLSNEAKT